MPSVFTQIIQGKIPCHKIMEDDRFLAFLDLRPIKTGHTLVIPKAEIDYIFNLEDNVLGDLMVFAKKVAKALEKAIPCKRIGIMVAGLEVPHTHVHLIPMDAISDLSFAKAKTVPAEELSQVASKIRGCV